ncbi:hypothetical protein AP058_02615 [Flavobacterium sp. TAB 87]|nr:hypothetical protein AP058_02615 [Flavobacterium sp. TAB 87]
MNFKEYYNVVAYFVTKNVSILAILHIEYLELHSF